MSLIELQDVSLTFSVRRCGRVTLKEYLLGGMFKRSKRPSMEVRALNCLNLTVGEGDRLGVIGHNGAGKSTLLKLLAGVYPPSEGRRSVRGQISSLFELALGFETDATGWENIAFRGFLQGETPKSIRSKVAEIAEFSELGEYLQMPIRYYSSGMLIRLAFSIATAIQPDILLIDEVLSAGDLAFQNKARQRMKSLITSARAVVMVSHDLSSVQQLCDRVVWMDHGEMRMVGPASLVVQSYIDEVEHVRREAA